MLPPKPSKNAQIPQLKQARTQGKIAYFRQTKLIVKDRPVRSSDQPRNDESLITRLGKMTTQGHSRDVAADGGVAQVTTPIDAATASDDSRMDTAGSNEKSRDAAYPSLPPPVAGIPRGAPAPSLSQVQDTTTRKSLRRNNSR